MHFRAGPSPTKEVLHCLVHTIQQKLEPLQFLSRISHMLQGSGVPLASDQVQYSLLYREPERNGVLDTCRELGITLIAYSPLCQGLLTGTPGTACPWR